MGVEVRIHIFFPLLVLVLFAMSGPQGWPRGLALFILLVAAVAVRETARLLIAAGPARHPVAAHRRTVRLCQP